MPTLKRVPAETAIDEGLSCSFCGRAPAADSDLIAGADVFICDECVAACSEMTAASGDERRANSDAEEGEDVEEPPVRQTFFRLLTDGDVAGLLPMDTLTEAMEMALRRFSTGGVVQPVRTVVPVGDQFFGLMPAYVHEPAALGAKLLSLFSRNKTR